MAPIFPKLTAELLTEYRADPARFIEEQCVILDGSAGSKNWCTPTLFDLQRRFVRDVLMTRNPDGTRRYHVALACWPRKSTKTTLLAMLCKWAAVCCRDSLVLLLSPQADATRSLGFDMIRESFERNVSLTKATGARIYKDAIELPSTHSEIRVLPCSPASGCGVSWTMAFADELHLFTTRQQCEWFDLVTAPNPARPERLLLLGSYGPVVGRSRVLERLLRLRQDPPADHYISWIRGQRVIGITPWLTAAFLRSVRRTMPPARFKQVFLALPVRCESAGGGYAFSRSQISGISDASWREQTERPDGCRRVVIGVDYAPIFDATAVVVLGDVGGTPTLLAGKALHGSRDKPVSDDQVQALVAEYAERFGAREVYADPDGLEAALAAWQSAGLRVYATGFTPHRIASTLWRAVTGRRLRLYSHALPARTPDGRTWTLQDELARVRIGMAGGWRLSHDGKCDRPGRGYDDRCCALGLALQAFDLSHARRLPRMRDTREVMIEAGVASPVRCDRQPAVREFSGYGMDGIGLRMALPYLGRAGDGVPPSVCGDSIALWRSIKTR